MRHALTKILRIVKLRNTVVSCPKVKMKKTQDWFFQSFAVGIGSKREVIDISHQSRVSLAPLQKWPN